MKHQELTNKLIELFSSVDETLLSQFQLSVATEETDEVGYFVNFSLKEKTAVQPSRLKTIDVIGKDENGKTIVGFVLVIKGGYINYLEGYTFQGEKWPDSDKDIVLEIIP